MVFNRIFRVNKLERLEEHLKLEETGAIDGLSADSRSSFE